MNEQYARKPILLLGVVFTLHAKKILTLFIPGLN